MYTHTHIGYIVPIYSYSTTCRTLTAMGVALKSLSQERASDFQAKPRSRRGRAVRWLLKAGAKARRVPLRGLVGVPLKGGLKKMGRGMGASFCLEGGSKTLRVSFPEGLLHFLKTFDQFQQHLYVMISPCKGGQQAAACGPCSDGGRGGLVLL